MQNFELLRNVTIGQYIPVDSPVHRLDPRAKVICTGLLFLAMSATRSVVAALLLIGLLLAIARLANLPISYVLRGLLPGMGFIIFLFVMQLLFQGSVVPCNVVFVEWWFIRITPCILELVLLGMTRVVAFIFIVSLLTMTTTASHLNHAIEMLLSPLKRLGLPVHEVALANMIALRFVPTLVEEMERIMKAQASRGAEIGSEKWWQPVRVARGRLPLVVPLFVNALRRAEDLVLAMESRCYVGGKGRTKYVQFHSRPLDWVIVAAMAFVYVAVLVIPWPTIYTLFPGL